MFADDVSLFSRNQGWWRRSNRGLHQSHLRGAAFTSSFAEEASAMQLALEWAITNRPEYSLTICTDSQTQLKAIERRSP